MMIAPLVDLSGLTYQNLIKPVLFAIHPDHLHERSLAMGELLAQTRLVPALFNTIYNTHTPRLQQKIAGIVFPRPIGLAAGYDYQAALTQITHSIGFGWQTVGSITYGAYGGNQPPMYGRLVHTKSLWVNKGFKNAGAAAIAAKMQSQHFPIPVGVSIGATNKIYTHLKDSIAEYERAFVVFKPLANLSYFELNISCPNLHSTVSYNDPAALDSLLQMVDNLALAKPVLIKMPIDITDQEMESLLRVIVKHDITGVIIGNLTKKRHHNQVWMSEASRLPAHGGLSGKATQASSDRLIAVAHRYAGDRLIIVGCGGIFNAADAYRKLRLGASLLQMITGLMFQGPQVVAQINRDLLQLMDRDGFSLPYQL